MHALTLIQQHPLIPGDDFPFVAFCAGRTGDSPPRRATTSGRIAP